MKKFNLFIFFALFLIFYTPLAIANGPLDDCSRAGGSCKATCDISEIEVTGTAQCVTLTCCRPRTGQQDCAEGETWVAVFRKCVEFGTFINLILQWGIILAAGAAAVRVLVGGIQYVFTTGDPQKLENAHATMTSAIFGLVIIVIAWLLMKVLGGAVEGTGWQIWFGMPGS